MRVRPLLAVLLLCGTLPAQTAESASVQDLLILAADGPVLVRCRITVDGKPFRAEKARYLERLFAAVDRDRGGTVDRDEAARTPSPSLLGGGDDAPTAADLLRMIDAGPAGVPRDDYLAWVDAVMGEPLRVRTVPPSADRAVNLVARLDRDRDGRLTPAELADPSPLFAYDFDLDGTLSAAELAPFRDSAAAAVERAAFDPTASPFRLISTEEQRNAAAAEVARRYESDVPLPADPHLVLDADLLFRNLGRPRLSVAANAAPDRVTVEPAGDGLRLTAGGLEVTLSAAGVSFVTGSSAVSLLLTQSFFQADGDKNRYLDPDEFSVVALPGGPTFADVDSDSDGMVTRDEVKRYLIDFVLLSATRVYLLAGDEGRSLFTLLDADADGRLTANEFAAAPDVLAGADRDGDGSLSAGELVGHYTLEFGPGRPPLPGDERNPMMSAEMAGAGVDAATVDAPRWFTGLDRNADGAVTWPEFAGPRSAFDRIDSDGDGRLVPSEATP